MPIRTKRLTACDLTCDKQQQRQLEWSNVLITRKQTATVYFTTCHGTALTFYIIAESSRVANMFTYMTTYAVYVVVI